MRREYLEKEVGTWNRGVALASKTFDHLKSDGVAIVARECIFSTQGREEVGDLMSDLVALLWVDPIVAVVVSARAQDEKPAS